MTADLGSDRTTGNLVLAAAYLAATGVRFVVVGGCALRMHELEHRPADLDIVPEPSLGNLYRILDALDGLGSVGSCARPDDRVLSTRDIVTRTTPIGSVDLLLLRGRQEYSTLASRAADVHVNGRPVRVAAFEDVMRLRARFGKGPIRA